LKELEYENIIKLHKIIRAENGEDLYLVFEYMDSDLHYAIRTGILEEDHKRYIIYQLLKSILFIHSSNVVHRDLKPENLLLNTSCQLKVADFGLARSVHETEGSAYPMTEYVATRWYRAPEIVLGSSVYTKAVDMWAIGCIIAELYSSKPLFPGKSTIDQLTKIMEITGRPTAKELEETAIGAKTAHRLIDNITRVINRSLESVLPDCSEDAIDLISKLLKFSPKDRLTVEEAIAHPYVEKFRDTKEEKTCERAVRIPIDDNTRRSVDTYKEELYRLSDVELVPSNRTDEGNNKENSGSEESDKVEPEPKDEPKKKNHHQRKNLKMKTRKQNQTLINKRVKINQSNIVVLRRI
jgi:mitogen-activated protein kinase 15